MSRQQRQVTNDDRSAVDSFYGGRRSQQGYEDVPTSAGGRRSTYGHPDDQYTPQDLQYRNASIGGRSAGYTADSYSRNPDAIEPVKGGADKELGTGAGWDVYADFNNKGPKYSSGLGIGALKSDTGYRPLSRPPTVGTRSKGAASTAYEPEVELVTVPAMGAEWSADELRSMKKSGKAEIKAEKRRKNVRAFLRDEKGLCGIRWLTRKFLVFFFFGLIIVVGLMLYFLIPRAPDFAFNFATPLVSNGGPAPYFNRVPANFSFTANVDLQADTHASYIPIHFHNISASLYSTDTNKLVATGSTGSLTMKAKSFVPLPINVTFAYDAVNTSDTTWNLYYLACRNAIAAVNATRPGLNMRLVLEMKIAGLIGSYGAATLLSNTPCPIQLPVSAG